MIFLQTTVKHRPIMQAKADPVNFLFHIDGQLIANRYEIPHKPSKISTDAQHSDAQSHLDRMRRRGLNSDIYHACRLRRGRKAPNIEPHRLDQHKQRVVYAMDTTNVQPWWRHASPILKSGAIGLLVVFNSACVGSPVEQKTDNAFLVEAWKMKMTRKDADHVVIAYQPLVSSAKKYTGANYKSDGKVLRVSLPSCMVNDQCETMVPSEVKHPSGAAFWYEVVIPYKGEKVLVDGNGPVVDELKLSEE